MKKSLPRWSGCLGCHQRLHGCASLGALMVFTFAESVPLNNLCSVWHETKLRMLNCLLNSSIDFIQCNVPNNSSDA